MHTEKTSDVYKHLYHYTNWKGLLGILDSQSIWATHFKFLNDRSEIMLFMKEKFPEILYPHVLKRYEDILHNNPEMKEKFDASGNRLDDIVKEDVKTAIDSMYEPLKDQIYIASFCGENSDPYINENGLLSQWRAYGSDGGFAIIFDTKSIERCTNNEHKKFLYGYTAISDVVYSNKPEKLEEEFSFNIDTIASFFNEVTDHIFFGKGIPDGTKNDPYSSFLNCVARYKHRGFSEENEVRIVTHIPYKIKEDKRPKKSIKFREVKGEQVPYIELFKPSNFPKIKKIIVGPHREKENRKTFLQTKLKHTNIDIITSDIPYSG